MTNLLKPQSKRRRIWWQRSFRWLEIACLLLLTILVSCSQQPETVTVEVTRVVTETVVTEGETVEVEVTRVVTETVVETVEVEPEAEPDGDLPSATGSEGDAEPLPPPPDNGPKVAISRGSTPAAEIALETAVTLRASQINQTNSNSASQSGSVSTSATISPEELQKWCQLTAQIYKKRCSN